MIQGVSVILSILIISLHAASAFRIHSSSNRQSSRLSDLCASYSNPLIVGLNKYSHDASCCVLDGTSGEILFCQAKERITGKKHDGGAVGSLMRYALDSIGATIADIDTLVTNNHHFRVKPFERRLPFSSSLNYCPKEYNDEYNILPKVPNQYELSHHLAHAWSVISTVPFDRGVILVMDGMGESYKAMMEDMTGAEEHSGDYMHDLKLLKAYGTNAFIGQPTSLLPGSSYREAETAYVFDRNQGILRPVFKRWGRERSPPELYNHGFENMESLGAIYSRISSHVLGDWNACGKIMGLAPWSSKKRADADSSWYFNSDNAHGIEKLGLGTEFYHKYNFLSGNPIVSDSFKIDWDVIESLQHTNQWSDERFGFYANIAQSIQTDLEQVALDLSIALREATGEDNLAVTGGVALNSVMNGKLRKDAGYSQMYVPAAPGDEGIALGCALYGLQRKREAEAYEKSLQQKQQSDAFSFPRNGVQALMDSVDPDQYGEDFGTNDDLDSWKDVGPLISSKENEVELPQVVPFHKYIPAVAGSSHFSAYQGRQHTEDDMDSALYEMDPWIKVQNFESIENIVEDATNLLTEDSDHGPGKVISWFQGKSEFGQRALGARSILADPRRADMRRFINEKVKLREWYRPLAPSVLDEHVGDWFEDLMSGENASPYMSLTATIREDKVSLVPAVSHVDGTARLQTVQEGDCPLYHQLINAFYKRTGVPMILNTSFNKKGQPIVESPLQAIQTLFSCEGYIDALYIGANKITIKPPPFDMKSAANEPTAEEADIIVRASPLYISEVTTQSGAAAGLHGAVTDSSGVVRIRIQDGAINSDVIAIDANVGLHVKGGDDDIPVVTDADSDDGDVIESAMEDDTNESISFTERDTIEWRELPGELHHEILQLFQVEAPSEEELAEAGITLADFQQQEDLSIGEILDAMRAIRSDDITWSELRDALHWLYMKQLLYFEDSNAENNAANQLFGSAEVLDLRPFT